MPYVFSLDVSAVNWADDLLDNNLSLVVWLIQTSGYEYAYWYGYDAGADAPKLDITYSVSASTPLPAALPLFASGLGALGLLGWRRKRKAQAARAAA